MAKRVKTVRVGGGANYAKVADRLKIFWEENPNGKIDSEREALADGKIRFIARIWRDSDEIIKLAKAGTSAEVILITANATASADATKKGEKENEKLETVAVGRALAMLGYLASGEVASREEMEEFERFKSNQEAEIRAKSEAAIKSAKSMDELKSVFVSLSPELKAEFNDLKNEIKAKLEKK